VARRLRKDTLTMSLHPGCKSSSSYYPLHLPVRFLNILLGLHQLDRKIDGGFPEAAHIRVYNVGLALFGEFRVGFVAVLYLVRYL
jgi:hypothetical protein